MSLPVKVESSLSVGDLCVCQHSYQAPDCVQIVDFTKTKKSARVRFVPMKSTYDFTGGNHVLDREWLSVHPIPKKPGPRDWDATIRVGSCERKPYLVKGDDYFFVHNNFTSCTSCEY